MKQQILIAGGRTKAKSLALSLAQKGCSITILNKNADDCQYLAESTPCKVICADATKPMCWKICLPACLIPSSPFVPGMRTT